MGKKTVAVNVRDFPQDLHYRLTVEAAKRRMSLKAVIVEAATEWLKRKGGKR